MRAEGKQRILVVDDEPDILTLLSITLRARGGFEVEACASGAEVPEAVRRFDPDLVLLDVMMPGADGPTTLRTLRNDPKTATVPIVFLTARTTKHDTARYLGLGAVAVIAKPFDQRTLADELQQILGRLSSPDSPGSDPELVKLMNDYAGTLPGKIREIRELWARLVSSPDAETKGTLYRRVHNLAGTAATFGYPVLSEEAQRLERELRNAAANVAPTAVMRRAVDGLIDALDAAAGSGRPR